MNRTLIQRIGTGLIPLIVTACAVAGWTQSALAREDARARLAKAEAMFAERCKTAGEKIYRTAENVEGIFLMKIRPKEINYGDQFKMDDPYGRDVGGDGYLMNFLLGRDPRGSIVEKGQVRNGYTYVEAVDQKDGKRYRYTGRMDQPSLRDKRYGEWVREFVLDKVPAPGLTPRYGVTYDDISTREEREHWIAGSSLRVVDLSTNEVMAERIGYMMDRGQGNTSAGRSPWLLAAAHACPAFPTTPGGQPFKMDQTRDFVEKVLVIKKEN